MKEILVGIFGATTSALQWYLFGLGVLLSLILRMAGVPALAFALGMYLPISINAAVLAGAVAAWIEHEPPDAMEAWSSNVNGKMSHRIRSLANLLKIPVVANSDAHWTADVGRWANVLEEQVESAAGVIAAIREGRFRPEERQR